MKVKSESEVTQSCPTLSNVMDCSLPGSSVHGIFQARVLEWVANVKGEIDMNTIIVEDFNFPLTSMDRCSTQNIKKATEILNNTTEQLDLIVILEYNVLKISIKSNCSIVSFRICYLTDFLSERFVHRCWWGVKSLLLLLYCIPVNSSLMSVFLLCI